MLEIYGYTCSLQLIYRKKDALVEELTSSPLVQAIFFLRHHEHELPGPRTFTSHYMFA